MDSLAANGVRAMCQANPSGRLRAFLAARADGVRRRASDASHRRCASRAPRRASHVPRRASDDRRRNDS